MEWALASIALIVIFYFSRKRRLRTWEQKRARLRKWIRRTEYLGPDETGPRSPHQHWR